MKKIKLTLLSILLFGLYAFDSNIENSDPVIPVPVLRAQIVDLLTPVDFQLDEEKFVRIHFKYNSEGEIIILKIGTANKQIKDYLMQCLNKKKVDLPGELNKIYYLPLRIVMDD